LKDDAFYKLTKYKRIWVTQKLKENKDKFNEDKSEELK
jgi:hypothetical protein